MCLKQNAFNVYIFCYHPNVIHSFRKQVIAAEEQSYSMCQKTFPVAFFTISSMVICMIRPLEHFCVHSLMVRVLPMRMMYVYDVHSFIR